MSILSDVSETALITLRSRVIESHKDHPVIQDKMGATLLQKMTDQLPAETRARVLGRELPATLTQHIALRSRKYDQYTKEFLAQYADGLVVSLGSGFDTRYWRVSDRPWRYIEIDLPSVIEAKQAVLGDQIDYTLIGHSVLDSAWIKRITAEQSQHVLFLAEGLLMYLPPGEVINLFQALAASFTASQIVFEVVHKRYTKGLWKKSVEAKMERNLGSTAGSSYQFGVADATEIESYADNLHVVEEWSYFEDEDLSPRMMRFFRHINFVARTQWTIKAIIGEKV